MSSGLPVPRMSATLVFDTDGGPGWFRIDYQDPNARKPKDARRRCHCTTCGRPGHNSRSPRCPARVAPGSG